MSIMRMIKNRILFTGKKNTSKVNGKAITLDIDNKDITKLKVKVEDGTAIPRS